MAEPILLHLSSTTGTLCIRGQRVRRYVVAAFQSSSTHSAIGPTSNPLRSGPRTIVLKLILFSQSSLSTEVICFS